MPIPNDPQNRYWIDVSSANPKLVNELRPCLVTILAFDHGHMPGIAGTGFVIAANTDAAVVITAKHVLEHARNIQRPVPWHAPSPLFVPAKSKAPLLHEEKLRAFWMGAESGDMLYARHFTYHDSLDIGCCLLTPQEEYATQFKPISIPLDNQTFCWRRCSYGISRRNENF